MFNILLFSPAPVHSQKVRSDLIRCSHTRIPSVYVITRRDLQRHINHTHTGRQAAASEQKEATAADIHSYVNGQRGTSAEPKLEAAEVKVIPAEGSR